MDDFKEREDIDQFFYDPEAEKEYKESQYDEDYFEEELDFGDQD